MAHPIGSRSAERAPTFIKEWRQHLGLSQETVCERLGADIGVAMSPGRLSRIERGKTPYNQQVLEAMAKILGITPAELLSVRPGAESPQPLLNLWISLEPNERSRLVELARLMFTGKAG